MESSLPYTPTWSFTSVLALLVTLGLIIHRSIMKLREWLRRTRRKALLASLETIMEELMVFGVLSLLLGHWSEWVSKICVKQTVMSTKFYPCKAATQSTAAVDENLRQATRNSSCPQGLNSFVSEESIEQLGRLFLVLVVVHVFYCFFTVAVAMLRIYSWRAWEEEAKVWDDEVNSTVFHYLPTHGKSSSMTEWRNGMEVTNQSSFSLQHTSHPRFQNKFIILVVWFFRHVWRSINKADYMALRSGFISNQKLHITYSFHNYMLRSMEDDFREIVGISVPLWGYAIVCILLNVHGSNAYFWLSFIPATLIIAVGTKLNHIVTQLTFEVNNENQCEGDVLEQRDKLFWFGKPEFILWLIQVISFQNAFEMANLVWSLWEIKASSCFMTNHLFVVIRLTSGILFQFWCSYCTFPLYVIVTQMGSKAKKALVSESIRHSLHKWGRRAKRRCYQRATKHNAYNGSLTTASSYTSLDLEDKTDTMDSATLKDACRDISNLCNLAAEQIENFELPHDENRLQVPVWTSLFDTDVTDTNIGHDEPEASSGHLPRIYC